MPSHLILLELIAISEEGVARHGEVLQQKGSVSGCHLIFWGRSSTPDASLPWASA